MTRMTGAIKKDCNKLTALKPERQRRLLSGDRCLLTPTCNKLNWNPTFHISPTKSRHRSGNFRGSFFSPSQWWCKMFLPANKSKSLLCWRWFDLSDLNTALVLLCVRVCASVTKRTLFRRFPFFTRNGKWKSGQQNSDSQSFDWSWQLGPLFSFFLASVCTAATFTLLLAFVSLQVECQNYIRVLLVNKTEVMTCGTNAFQPLCITREVTVWDVVIKGALKQDVWHLLTSALAPPGGQHEQRPGAGQRRGALSVWPPP